MHFCRTTSRLCVHMSEPPSKLPPTSVQEVTSCLPFHLLLVPPLSFLSLPVRNTRRQTSHTGFSLRLLSAVWIRTTVSGIAESWRGVCTILCPTVCTVCCLPEVWRRTCRADLTHICKESRRTRRQSGPSGLPDTVPADNKHPQSVLPLQHLLHYKTARMAFYPLNSVWVGVCFCVCVSQRAT